MMTFAKRISFALNVISLLLVCAVYTQAQEAEPSIKIESTLVSVPVIVSDRSGRYIAGLKQADFTLYKDNVKQPIAFFTAEEEPLNIALLLDTSQSAKSVLDDIKDRAKDFLKQLRPQDKAIVVTFDYDVHILSPLTANRKELEKAVKRAEIGDYVGTTLRDALAAVFNDAFKSIQGRKAIILLTDGKDHGSRIPVDELLDMAEESDTMIYSIFYTTKMPTYIQRMPGRGRLEPFPRRGRGGRFPLLPEASAQQFPDRQQRRQRREQMNQEAAEFLEELSNISAGRFYRSEVKDLQKQFELIADELRHQYRLGFYPEGDRREGTLHRLRVEVASTDAVVRARRSYID